MMSKRKRQAELTGHVRSEITGAKEPDCRGAARARNSRYARIRVVGGKGFVEEREQFGEAGEEVIGLMQACATKGTRRSGVGAGRSAEAKVDPARMDRFEHAELLGNCERGVVRQHDAARAEADRRRGHRQVGEQHRRRRRRDARHVVMLRDPVAVEAQHLDTVHEVDRVAQRITDGGAARHRSEIENRETRPSCIHCHARTVPIDRAVREPRSCPATVNV